MSDVLLTFLLGAGAVLAGRLTLRAKSLIFPGYRDFGLSEDHIWAMQRLAGWAAVVWGGVIIAFGFLGLIELMIAA